MDEVTNLSGGPGEMQLLYHINFGPPLVEPGSRVLAPIRRLMPRDAHSAQGVRDWNRYGEPRVGAIEDVFFCELLAGRRRLHGSVADRRRRRPRRRACISRSTNCPASACGRTARPSRMATSRDWSRGRTFRTRDRSRPRRAASASSRPAKPRGSELSLEPHDTADAIAQAERRIQACKRPPPQKSAPPPARLDAGEMMPKPIEPQMDDETK